MNDNPSSSDPKTPGFEPLSGSLQSPIRPQNPDAAAASPTVSQPENTAQQNKLTDTITSPKNPRMALDILRRKMETVAGEFAGGKINRAQFNAIYGRYDEQRKIIERILERNPDSEAWQQVAKPGHTTFLRRHFTARCLYWVVYRLNWPRPLMMGGQQQPDVQVIEAVLASLQKNPNRPRTGLARKALGNGQWLALALGEQAVTIAMFNLEPSMVQLHRIRDLHNDFERANEKTLRLGTRTLEKMVFPQRALVEQP